MRPSMDGSEDVVLLEEIERLEVVQARLVELVADMAFRQALWQEMMTVRFREAAALRATNDRLRDELRRYTARAVV